MFGKCLKVKTFQTLRACNDEVCRDQLNLLFMLQKLLAAALHAFSLKLTLKSSLLLLSTLEWSQQQPQQQYYCKPNYGGC